MIWSFDRLENLFIGNSNIWRTIWKSCNVCLNFPEKWFSIRQPNLEEFQRFLRFPRKMVFYSSTNFGILKPWTSISNLIRFDLGFWQATKRFYRKLKYRDQVLEEFQCLPQFPRKMVLYSSTNFHILKPWTFISNS